MQKPLLYYQEFRLNMSCHIVQNQENQLCQLTPNKLPRLQLESYEDAKEIKPFFESKIAYPIEELRLFKYKRSINILIFSTPLKFNINFSFTEQDLISFLRIFIHRGAFFNFKNTNSTVYLELPTFIENAKENFFDFLIYEVLLFQHKNSFSDLSDFDIIKELKKNTIFKKEFIAKLENTRPKYNGGKLDLTKPEDIVEFAKNYDHYKALVSLPETIYSKINNDNTILKRQEISHNEFYNRTMIIINEFITNLNLKNIS